MAPCRTRTGDLLLTRQLLCHLSYRDTETKALHCIIGEGTGGIFAPHNSPSYARAFWPPSLPPSPPPPLGVTHPRFYPSPSTHSWDPGHGTIVGTGENNES